MQPSLSLSYRPNEQDIEQGSPQLWQLQPLLIPYPPQQGYYLPSINNVTQKSSNGWIPSLRYFLLGILELVILLVVFYQAVRVQYEKKSDCLSADGTYDTCYCEAFSDGYVLERVNTISALAFSLLGIFVLYSLSKSPPPPATNLMTRDIKYASVYGYLEIFMGPGSMLFHATMSWLGGFFDTLSMYLWIIYVLVFDIVRLTGIRDAVALLLYLALVSLSVYLQNVVFQGGDIVFATLVISTLLLEAIIYFRSKNNINKKAYQYLVIGLAVYAVAMIIWWFSQTGRVLCYPDSLIQGHAIWHALSAVTVTLVFLYLKNATDPEQISCK